MVEWTFPMAEREYPMAEPVKAIYAPVPLTLTNKQPLTGIVMDAISSHGSLRHPR